MPDLQQNTTLLSRCEARGRRGHGKSCWKDAQKKSEWWKGISKGHGRWWPL